MRCSFHDSLVWLYPDSEIGARPCTRVALDVARGGIAAITVLVNDASPGVPLKVTLTPAPREWKVYRLVDVAVEKNTGIVCFCEPEGGQPGCCTPAPYRTYDAMGPVAAAGFRPRRPRRPSASMCR